MCLSSFSVVHHLCKMFVGQVGTGLIGYQVRLDSRVCSKTKLTYCTTGKQDDLFSSFRGVVLDHLALLSPMCA